jgi:mannosyltransferase
MKKTTLYLLFTLLGAALLRLHNLTSISLWHDEAFSVTLIRYHWVEMFHRIAGDVHPPLYYILLKIWVFFLGDSLLVLRGLSLVLGVATVWATYLFVKEAFKNDRMALSAAVLIAVNPFQIKYVTEARMYTLGTFLILIGGYFMLKALKHKHVWRSWILTAIFASAALYTHYFLMFSVFAGFIYILLYLYKQHRFNLKEFRYGITATFVALLLFLPWLKTFIAQFKQVQENYWIPKMTTWSIPETIWKMLVGTNLDPAKSYLHIFLALGVLFSLYMLYVVVHKEKAQEKWLVIFGLIFPFAGAIASSWKQSIYLDRYFVFAGLFYTITLVVFLYNLKNTRLRTALFGIAVFISLFSWAVNWQTLHVAQKPGMHGAADYINSSYKDGDRIIVGTPFEFFNFRYYNETNFAPLLYTPGTKTVSELPHYSGTAILDNKDLLSDLNSGVEANDTVWMLWTNAFYGNKPEVPSNWIQVDEHSWEDAQPYLGTWIIVTEYQVK